MSLGFGVTKIEIGGARALQKRCGHFVPPPTKLGLIATFKRYALVALSVTLDLSLTIRVLI